ncbi:LysR family transcriptional regulator [Streptomyces sp. NPDC057654]|uniref:LysR family transcriptional regulator n=1 Tax=Streptomyces sp. NPDC057654 TaxID=3346196 RepID=UPI0036C557BA
MALELADLRVFVTAASVGSLSAAARELRAAQPSVSERLRRLERLVGKPLLDRSNRGVSLTPAGARLLPHAERCLELADRALDIAREDDTQGTLHMTTHASYAQLAVPFVVSALRPLRYAVVVDDQHTPSALQRVAAGTTDLAVTLPMPHAHEVRLHAFRSEPVIAVCRPDHPLAAGPAQGSCDIAGLSGHPLAVNRWGTGADLFHEQLLDAPTRAHQLYEISSAETAADLARSGQAVAVLTRATVERDLAAAALVRLDVRDMPEWRVDLMLAHHRARAAEPAIAAVVAALTTERP